MAFAKFVLLLRRAPIAAVARSIGRYPPCNKMYPIEDYRQERPVIQLLQVLTSTKNATTPHRGDTHQERHDRDGCGLRQLILPITEDAPRDAPRPPSSPARHAGHEDQVGLAAVCSGSPGLSFPVREGQGTPSGTSVPLRAPGTSGTCPALPHARPPSACTSPALVPSPLPGAMRPCAPGPSPLVPLRPWRPSPAGAPRLPGPLASLGPSPPWAPIPSLEPLASLEPAPAICAVINTTISQPLHRVRVCAGGCTIDYRLIIPSFSPPMCLPFLPPCSSSGECGRVYFMFAHCDAGDDSS